MPERRRERKRREEEQRVEAPEALPVGVVREIGAAPEEEVGEGRAESTSPPAGGREAPCSVWEKACQTEGEVSVISGKFKLVVVVCESGKKTYVMNAKSLLIFYITMQNTTFISFPDEDTAAIRVSNLSENTQEGDLQELFKPFGHIARIFLAKDKITGQCKGFAFINYYKKDDAAKAIATLNGFGYDHLILNVEWAKPSGS